ncbi:SDR family NAD(P)-dependent oxidoreductase, partial [Staphylococcus aureus]
GIGTAICRRLAAAGHPVVVNYASSAAAADALVSEIVAGGGSAVAIAADVADVEAVDAMFRRAEATIGAPTILVNNAGV